MQSPQDTSRLASLQQADVSWQDGHPRSDQYADIYYNQADGLAESTHTFLSYNRIPQRWLDESTPRGSCFTIAETGFGTGLNFLNAANQWQQCRSAGDDAVLHFLSVEKSPLSPAALQRALSQWPQFGKLSEDLQRQYPAPVPGTHRLQFDNGRIQLTLLFGDVIECYQAQQFTADAWFLDGFAPSRNPDMWRDELFSLMARRSWPGTTFSTFTAAGFIRRGLAAAGFSINKVAGFGRKREMLTGTLMETPPQPAPASSARKKPVWCHLPTGKPPDNRQAVVVGAGLAGCHTARELAQRGWQVTVLDRLSHPAGGASGNARGMLYFKPPVQWNPAAQFYLQGYLHALRCLADRFPGGMSSPNVRVWDNCGLLQLACDNTEASRQQKLLATNSFPAEILHPVSRQEAEALCGSRLTAGGLYFPGSGWVDCAALCRSLLDHPAITFLGGRTVGQLERVSNLPAGWRLKDVRGNVLAEVPVVILCQAHDLLQLPGFETLPLQKIRGQVSSLSVADNRLELDCVVCGKGYVAPPDANHRLHFGASYNLRDESTEVRLDDHQANLAKLGPLLPNFHPSPNQEAVELGGRVSFRCTVGDYMPIIGPMYDLPALQGSFRSGTNREAVCLPGLYLNVGHGSRGLVSAPLAGTLLADMVTQQPGCLGDDVLATVLPARFPARLLARGKMIKTKPPDASI